jgi:hypothetical protein
LACLANKNAKYFMIIMPPNTFLIILTNSFNTDNLSPVIQPVTPLFIYHHHQPINVPTAGAPTFLMDYPQGASEGTLSRWSRLCLQSLAPTNLQWACVAGYGPFSLSVIYKKVLCRNSGDY